MERALFVKIMNLTTSSEDGEALSSIRRANKALKDSNLTWDDIISKGTAAKPQPKATISDKEAAEIVEEILRAMARQAHYEKARKAQKKKGWFF